jgi:class 3 adenylate cyclase
MLDLIDLLNQERAGLPPLRIGVGIASGEVIAGYTGTQQRATYTCVGDTVNLAARLEAHTKEAGCALLMDGATREALGAAVPVRELGLVAIKGKVEPVALFTVDS